MLTIVKIFLINILLFALINKRFINQSKKRYHYAISSKDTIMKKFLFLLSMFIITLFFLLFHDKGNQIIKPFLSNYLETKLENNMSVEVKTLKIDKKQIEIIALLDKISTIKIKGELSLLTQSLDLKYQIFSNGFKHKTLSFEEKIDINGSIKGSFDDIKVTGKGDAFLSKLNYQFLYKEESVQQVEVNIKKADLSQLFLLLGEKNYASGSIDIHVKIPSLDKENAKGTASLQLFDTLIHEEILKQELNITLPPKTKITAKIDSTLQGEKVFLKGNIQSTLANLSFKEAIYHLEKKSFASDYKIQVKELDALKSLTTIPLHGSLELHGFIEHKGGIFSLRGESNSFEGTSFFSIRQKKLQLNFKAINLKKLLHFAGQKPYAQGGFSADIYIDNIKTLDGRFSLRTNIAKTINRTFKKELNITLDKPINFMLSIKGNIKKGIASLNSDLLSDLFNLTSQNIHYTIKNSSLRAPYRLDIPHLSKLQSILGKKMKGKLELKGKITKTKSLKVTGHTNDLEGDIDFILKDELLNAKIKDASLERLMHILIYPQVFKGKLEGELNYNLTTQEGKLHAKLKQAQLLRSYLTVTVKDFKRLDLTKERYNESSLNASFKKEMIYFDFIAQSTKSIISLSPAKLNKNTNTIEGKYSLQINNNYVTGRIHGPLDDPHVSINASEAIQQEVVNQLEKQLDKELGQDKLKKLGIGKEEKYLIKNIIEGFF